EDPAGQACDGKHDHQPVPRLNPARGEPEDVSGVGPPPVFPQEISAKYPATVIVPSVRFPGGGIGLLDAWLFHSVSRWHVPTPGSERSIGPIRDAAIRPGPNPARPPRFEPRRTETPFACAHGASAIWFYGRTTPSLSPGWGPAGGVCPPTTASISTSLRT